MLPDFLLSLAYGSKRLFCLSWRDTYVYLFLCKFGQVQWSYGHFLCFGETSNFAVLSERRRLTWPQDIHKIASPQSEELPRADLSRIGSTRLEQYVKTQNMSFPVASGGRYDNLENLPCIWVQVRTMRTYVK